MAEQRFEAIAKELSEMKKDIDIKIGSKNLLNFGLSHQEIAAKKEVKEHVKNYIEQKLEPIISDFDCFRKEVEN